MHETLLYLAQIKSANAGDVGIDPGAAKLSLSR
jgi:hypothetical protein